MRNGIFSKFTGFYRIAGPRDPENGSNLQSPKVDWLSFAK